MPDQVPMAVTPDTTDLPRDTESHVVLCNCWPGMDSLLWLRSYIITLRRTMYHNTPIVVLSDREGNGKAAAHSPPAP
jgi:hypothetical protein